MRPLIAFAVLAYAITWGWWISLAAMDETVRRGDAWPTHVPGLLGPMVAAIIVTGAVDGRRGLRSLGASMVRVPGGRVAWAAALAPAAFAVPALAIAAITGAGDMPDGLGRASGVTAGIGWVVLALAVGAYGEETGWRGFALARLQQRVGAMRATIVVAAMWAGWHAPAFLILDSYAGFGPLMLAGFLVGLAAGAFVLTAVFNLAGGSVLAVVIWHVLYNLAVGTEGGGDLTAVLVSACVIAWAITLIQRERHGIPALGGPRP